MKAHFAIATATEYAAAFRAARAQSSIIAQMTSEPSDVIAHEGHAYLSKDGLSGFYVRTTGELCGVFSLEKGRGDRIVQNALFVGASHLDCFDGYLPTLYARHGFVVDRRERNYTAGGPDVVYMVHTGDVDLDIAI